MKVLTIVLLSVTIIAAAKIPLRYEVAPKKLVPAEFMLEPLAGHIPWESVKDYVLEHGELQGDYVEADITEYVRELLANLNNMFIEKGFDPTALPDQQAELSVVGSMTLTSGSLSHLSTMTTFDTVLARYTHGSKILELDLPLGFESILINYDYVTRVTLITITGDLQAEVRNFRINLRTGFNFSNYHAFVDDLDVRDSGAISLDIHGTGITDVIINLMSDVLITLFHGILLTIINSEIQDPFRSFVDSVNNAIDAFLQPNSTFSYY